MKQNLVGLKFSRLTVLSEDKDRCTCQCDCGKITITNRYRILSNHTRSCGCLQKEALINRNHKLVGVKTTKYGASFGAIRKTYRIKGKKYDLTDDQFHILITSNCHYCNASPSNIMKDVKNKNNVPFVYNGVDRVNNELGYSISNSVSCCKRCNIAKNDMSYSDFIDLCKKIANRH
jgi:hypothetical protein